MASTQFEIVCLDEYGGIARSQSGDFPDVDSALQAALTSAPEHFERVVIFNIDTSRVVWQGTRGEAERKTLPA